MEKGKIKYAFRYLFFMLSALLLLMIFGCITAVASEKPHLTVNGKELEILSVEQSYLVTFRVTTDGLPVSGQQVSLDGYGAIGITGPDGTLTTNITPHYGDDIGIHIGDQYYRGVLFAVEDNQSVVEVRLKDNLNNDLSDFFVLAKNEDMQRGIDGEGIAARVLAREGQNTIIAERWGDGDTGSYFVKRDVYIDAGTTVKLVQITQTDYIEADIAFIYDSSSISNAMVFVGNYFADSGWFTRDVGHTNDSGFKKIFISPGTYRIAVNGRDSTGESIYFMDDKQITAGIGSYTCQWYQANTGIVNLAVTGSIPTVVQKCLVLEGSWIDCSDLEGVRINCGVYNLDMIGMKYDMDGQLQWHNYRRPPGDEETITISPGATVSLCHDLTPQPLLLRIYEDNMQNGSFAEGSDVHFGVVASTPSGYMLDYYDGDMNADITITKPNGEIDHMRSGFRDIWYYVDSKNPAGQYVVNVTGNLGGLYGDYNLTEYFTVEKPLITIDDLEYKIINVNEEASITIRAAICGQPMAGLKVSLDGYGDIGETGSDGSLTINITPRYGDDIGIHIGDRYYRGILFAVEENQSVVEVRLKDKNGADLSDFFVFAKNGDMQREVDGEGNAVRVLAREGYNTIIAERWGDGHTGSYFVERDVYVDAGTSVTTVQITQSDYIETDICFRLDDNPICNATVFAGKHIEGGGLLNRGVGNTGDVGIKKMYITPGAYKIAVNGKDSISSSFYFMDNIDIMPEASSYTCQWYQLDMGMVSLAVTGPVCSEMQKYLVLDGSWIDYNNSVSILINSGVYNIDMLGMEYKIEDKWQWYHYRKPQGYEETLTINPGATISLSYDLTPQPLTLNIYEDNMQNGVFTPDSDIHFGVQAPTPSGYFIYDKEGNRDVNITVRRPDGQKYNWSSNFRDIWYHLGGDSPSGQYTINVSGNLSMLYGDFSFIGYFTVEKPSVTIDGADYKIIRAREESQITIRAAMGDQALGGQDVYLDGYGYMGTTDENGMLTTSFTPDYGSDIGIHVGQYFYQGKLFAVDNGQGVAEVRLWDMEGNQLSNFFVKAQSQYMGNEVEGDGNGVRILVNEGQNALTIARSGDGDEGSYFINKEVYMSAGLFVNTVDITQSDYIEAELTFMLDSSPINNVGAVLGSGSTIGGWFTRYIGSTNDDGIKKAYVSPGLQYSVAAEGYYNGNQIYLLKEGQQILCGNNIYQWYQEDTGRVRLTIVSPLPGIMNKVIRLNGQWISIDDENGIIMNNGSYMLNLIQLKFIFDGRWMWCEYRMPEGQEETVTIGTGIQDLIYDLTPQELYLDISCNEYNIPGDIIHCGVVASTPSGYQLYNMSEHHGMDIAILMPDGREDAWHAWFKRADWMVNDNEPTGEYTINVSGSFYPLYGDYSLAGTFKVVRPEVTVNDKEVEIVRAGQSYPVTIRAAINGQPLSGKDVFISSYGIVGTTDDNGVVTTTIEPYWGQNYDIFIGECYYGGILFAVEDNQGVIEVVLKDNGDNDIEGFFVKAHGERMEWQIDCRDKKARVLACEGRNTVVVARTGQGDNGSYYIVKDIDVTAGLDVNSMQITKADYIEANMKYMYDSEYLKYSTVIIGKAGFDYTNKDIGSPNDSGIEKVYVSPGDYKVAVSGRDSNYNTLYLIKDNEHIDNSVSDYTFQWYQDDTCRVRMDMNSPLPSIMNIVLDLSGSWISFNDSNGVIINSGDYTINKIHMDYDVDGQSQWCDYEKPYAQREILQIRPGTLDLFYDLTPEALYLGIDCKEYNQPGDAIWYGVVAPTPSGYELVDMSNHHNAYSTIIFPDGNECSTEMWFRRGGWMVDVNEPLGEYTIKIDGNLHPLYGDFCLTGRFIVGIPQIEINNKPYEIIRVGEESQITVSASVNGYPVANKMVYIGHYVGGLTDENGRFSAVIRPDYGQNIVITIDINGGQNFSNELFAVDEDQGVVEVSASDRQGNMMQDIWVRITSKDMNMYNNSGKKGDRVRILANKGENLLLLNQHADGIGYNITEQINAIPGININRIHIDGANTIEADMYFMYDGEPIANGDIILENLDLSYYGYMHGYLGQTDSFGNIRVYTTPGQYMISINKTDGTGTLNSDNTLMYLKKDRISVDSCGRYDMAWGSSDVGRLKVNIKSPFYSTQKQAIELSDSMWIFIGNGKEMLISSGTYEIGGIHIEDDTNGEWVGYEFRKPRDKRETIIIGPGKLLNYNADLTIKDVDLKLGVEIVQKCSPIKFGIQVLTNSGYVLDWMSKYNMMDVSITRPDGNILYYWNYFRDGGYFVEKDDPEGMYEVNVDACLGPCIGCYCFTKKFQVVGDMSVYIDSTYPRDKTTGVPVSADINVNFHCPIQKGDNFTSIALTAENSISPDKVNVEVTIENNKLTINPVNDLEYDTKYIVTIPSASVVNVFGQWLKDEYSFTFTTQKPANMIIDPGIGNPSISDRLMIEESYPANNSTGVPVGQIITIVFNNKIDVMVYANDRARDEFKNQAINLKTSNGEQVPIQFMAVDNKLIVKPKYNLNFDTEYILTVPQKAVCDYKRNSMESDYYLCFVTEPMEHEIPESVKSEEQNTAPETGILSVDDISVTIVPCSSFELPKTVTAKMSDRAKWEVPVVWDLPYRCKHCRGSIIYSGMLKDMTIRQPLH